jgi:poly(3-hydroxybutyrate) depolymerase
MHHSIRSALGAAGRLAVVLSAAWATPLAAGCGGDGWRSGAYALDHGGVSRSFRVHVPAGFRNDVPAPLVLLFHGWGGDENEFLGAAPVTALADQRGYILVAPRGLGSGEPDHRNNSWTFSGSATGLDGDGLNDAVAGDSAATCDDRVTPDYSYGSCAAVKANGCSWTHCQDDDVAFAVALVAQVSANLCVDAARVYAAGGSNGGMFTWELAQNAASAPLFRAVAPLIGLPHRGYLQGKGRAGDLPALLITGTRDNVVPPGRWEDPSHTVTSNGSDRYYYTGATAITRSWARAHGCDTGAAAAPFDDGNRETDCRSYCAGDRGWPRVLDCRADMGHEYGLPWAWKLILDFFDHHAGQGLLTVREPALP